MRYLLPSALILCLLLTLSACGAAESEDADGSSRGAWSIEQDGLALEEEFYITETEDFFFSNIYDVTVREDGRIYVADGDAHHIKVLSPEGELLETIGEQGEGPGEFERPSEVVLARGDSLYVLDGYWGRISVFSPEHAFEYSVTARAERSSPRMMMIPEETEGYFFSYSRPVLPGEDGPHRNAIRQVAPDGTAGDTLFTSRSVQSVIEQDGTRMSLFRLPYRRAPHMNLGPDGRIHYTWSDSLRVVIYSRTGEAERTVEIPFEVVPVTQEDRDRIQDDASERYWSAIRNEIPETKPAFEQFVIDEAGRYWFQRPTEEHERSDWWVVDPDAQRVHTVSLPSDVTLHAIRGGFAYGEAEGEYGEPALVRYRIIE